MSLRCPVCTVDLLPIKIMMHPTNTYFCPNCKKKMSIVIIDIPDERILNAEEIQ